MNKSGEMETSKNLPLPLESLHESFCPLRAEKTHASIPYHDINHVLFWESGSLDIIAESAHLDIFLACWEQKVREKFLTIIADWLPCQ